MRSASQKAWLAIAAAMACAVGVAMPSGAAVSGRMRSQLSVNGTFWSARVRVDPPRGEVTSVSCATATFCAAVDAHGDALVFTGAVWSAPAAVDPGGDLVSVSCGAANACVAVDAAGNAVTYGGSWSTPIAIDPYGGTMVAVSCASATHCVTVDQSGNVVTDDAGNWGDAVTLPGQRLVPIGQGDVRDFHPWYAGQALTGSLSCPTVNFCVAMTYGDTWVLEGSTWSQREQVGSQSLLSSVSCSSSTFCLAVGGPQADAFTGSSWSPTSSSGDDLSYVSCASATSCTGLGEGVDTFDGTQWSSVSGLPFLGAYPEQFVVSELSCATLFCMVMASTGQAVTYDGTWSSIVDADLANFLDAVSCATTTFCMAADTAGSTLTFNGTSWTTPVPIDPDGGGFTSVSCPTAALCVAVDEDGDALVDTAGVWSAPVPLATTTDAALYGTPAITSVACPSATFCAAVGPGIVATWSSGTWSSTNDDAFGALQSVSCSSASYCLAAGLAGELAVLQGTTWSIDTANPLNLSYTSVACITGTTCDLGTIDGKIFTLEDGTLEFGDIIGGAVLTLSCPTTSFCSSMDARGNVYTSAGPYWLPGRAVDPSISSIVNILTDAAVSCPVVGDCVAVDAAGNAILGQGSPPTETVVGASAGLVRYGYGETLRARVWPPMTGGTVSFYASIGTGPLTAIRGCVDVSLTNSLATCTGVRLQGGENSILAFYNSLTPSVNANEAPAFVLVRRAPSHLTFHHSPVTSKGLVLHLRALLLPRTATGRVTFTLGGSRLCTGTLVEGAASCVSSYRVARGTHVLVATYSGSADYLPTQSVSRVSVP